MNRISLALALIVTFGSISQKSLKASETLYVSYGSAIFSYRINNNTGSLSGLPGSPLQIPGWVGSLALHPSGKFLYAETASGLAGYRVKSNGSLDPVPGSPFQVPQGILYFDPLGRFLYAVGGSDLMHQALSVYRVAANGALKVVGTPAPTGNFSTAITSDPFGRFVYVCNFGSHDITAYQVLDGGLLLSIPGSPFNIPVLNHPPSNGQPVYGDPNSIAADSTGRFLYVGNIFITSITGFRIDFNGALTYLPTASTPWGSQQFIQSMSIDPDNRFLFAPTSNQAISEYSLNNENGALSLISGTKTGIQPEITQADPKGKFLYVACADHILDGPVELDGFVIGPKGALTPVKGSPFMVPVPNGTFPDSIVISPGNTFNRSDRD